MRPVRCQWLSKADARLYATEAEPCAATAPVECGRGTGALDATAAATAAPAVVLSAASGATATATAAASSTAMASIVC